MSKVAKKPSFPYGIGPRKSTWGVRVDTAKKVKV